MGDFIIARITIRIIITRIKTTRNQYDPIIQIIQTQQTIK